MSMLSDYALIAILMTPVWFPPVRFAISLARKNTTQSQSRPFVWYYVITFIWAGGWVTFQWAIQIPSGIGYGLALFTAWPVMIIGMSKDPMLQ